MTEQIENEIEFECDRCGDTRYVLCPGIPSLDVSPYAQCLECGWMRPAIATEGEAS